MSKKTKRIIGWIIIAIYIVAPIIFMFPSCSSHWECWDIFNIFFIIIIWELLAKDYFLE